MPNQRFVLSSLRRCCLLAFWLCAASGAQAQPARATQPRATELHAGLEVGNRVIRAIALSIANGDEGYNIKVLYSESIIPTTPYPKTPQFTPEYIVDVAANVQRLAERMQRDFKVPAEQIYLIGLSEVAMQNREPLAKEIQAKAKRTITYLTPESEVELNIAGSIPRRTRLNLRTGTRYVDNRALSSLIEIGAVSTRGGYQQLRQPGRAGTEEFALWDVPRGTHNFAAEVTRAAGETADLASFAKRAQALSSLSYKALLRNESFKKPGMINRQKVYLTGGITWAMMTLLHPEDQRNYLIVTMADINTFYYRAVADPDSLLNPDLSKIADENIRNEIRKSREAVKAAYNAKTLVAGAELLRALAEELNFKDKTVIYPRFSYLSRILSYVRLQPE